MSYVAAEDAMVYPRASPLFSTSPQQGNMLMIKRSRMTIRAAATVLSVGVATQLSDKDTPHQRGAEVPGLQHCALELANCSPIVLAAAKDDDWTAWGGAMRGVEK